MSIDLLPPLTTFVIVALSEFGDKTEFAIVSLGAKYKPKPVFVGSLLAFALVNGVIALIFSGIGLLVPSFWIDLAAGVSFIVFGLYTLLSKEDMTVKIKEHSNVVSTSFFLVSLMEFGDKTQFAIMTLAAEYNSPIQILIGIMLAFTLQTALAVIVGKTLCRYITAKSIKIGTGLVFLAFGILLLLETFSGSPFI